MSDIQVINEKEDKSSLIHQYFINDEKNSNLQMIAFNQIKSEAVITANVSEDKWTISVLMIILFRKKKR